MTDYDHMLDLAKRGAYSGDDMTTETVVEPKCSMFIREDQDGSGRICKVKAVAEVGGEWYCEHHKKDADAYEMSKQEASRYEVVVSEYGEKLSLGDRPGSDRSWTVPLSSCDHHVTCRGFVDLKEVSETHVALTCRTCNLRVVIPRDVDTWGKFCAWMKKVLVDRRKALDV